ncbi:hypothetical protein [Paenibacillus sp. Y412MC10]|uniref:hypothetical protein n=1 Tax=Geobacillus sp. (strain Y412MC10) TaxID=481743 RepID=UPI0016432848|nr:hypothetical protein [Paenibacillus sp. Y412MC10]
MVEDMGKDMEEGVGKRVECLERLDGEKGEGVMKKDVELNKMEEEMMEIGCGVGIMICW